MDSDDSMEEFTISSKMKFKEKAENARDSKQNCCKENLIGMKFYSDLQVTTFLKKLEEKTKENYFTRDQKKKINLKDEKRMQANNQISSRFIRFQCIHGPVRDTSSTGKRKAL